MATRYGVEIQAATEIALTKLDVLAYLKRIPVCTAYEVNGVRTGEFPMGTALMNAKPVYEYFEGFGCDISACRKKEDLPGAARRYIEFVEKSVGCPIKYVSVGAERDAIIQMF